MIGYKYQDVMKCSLFIWSSSIYLFYQEGLMFKIISLLFLITIISCTTQKKSNDDSKFGKDSIGQIDTTIAAKIEQDDSIVHVSDQFPPTISGFKQMINKLDREELGSISISKDFVFNKLPYSVKIPDSLTLAYSNFFYETLDHFNQTFYTEYPDIISKIENDIFDEDCKNFEVMVNNNGLMIQMSEGTIYLDSSPDYFYTIFKSRVSESLERFIEIRKNEQQEGFSEDGGMLITFEELGKRVRRWEDYIVKYPNAFYIEDAKYYYNSYLATFLIGMDNTRVYSLEDNVYIPEIREIYKDYYKKNSSQESAEIVRKYYNLIESNGFQYNSNVQSFIERQNLDSYQGKQLHLR